MRSSNVSGLILTNKFRMPERVHRIAQRAADRSGLRVKTFKSKRELVQMKLDDLPSAEGGQ